MVGHVSFDNYSDVLRFGRDFLGNYNDVLRVGRVFFDNYSDVLRFGAISLRITVMP